MIRNKGFTLIELLVTTTIILLLTSIAIVSYASAGKRSRDNKRISDLETIRSALEIYRSDKGEYPPTLDDLVNSYINEIPTDPKPDSFSYYYSSLPPSYTTYTLCAHMETDLAKNDCAPNQCGSLGTCNYRMLPP